MTARFVFIFIALLSLNISGCTNTQQDTLLEKTMAFGRHAVGFDVRTQDVGDVQMNYMERQADGPVVVLVHGFSANKETWLKLAAVWHGHRPLTRMALLGRNQGFVVRILIFLLLYVI